MVSVNRLQCVDCSEVVLNAVTPLFRPLEPIEVGVFGSQNLI